MEVSYRHAAETQLAKFIFGSNIDKSCILLLGAGSEESFKSSWESLENTDAIFCQGYIFCPTRNGGDDDGGLAFDDETLDRTEMQNLQVLSWADSEEEEPQLFIHASNSGVNGDKGWCPASEFAARQDIKVAGQSGDVSFSEDDTTYEPISGVQMFIEIPLYLNAYDTNGDNTAIPPTVHDP